MQEGVGVFAVRALEDLLAVGSHHERATDALAAGPGTGGEGADVAAAGDPEAEGAGDGAVVVAPELSVGFADLVMIGRDGPGTGGKDDVGAHQAEGAADDLAGGEGIGADHEAEGAVRGAGHGEAIAEVVAVVADLEFVEFAVVEEEVAGGADEEGGVVAGGTGLLDQAGADVNPVATGGFAQAGGGLALGNGAGIRGG